MGGTTLSNGFYKPANPDTGDVFFPAISNNWQLVNDHTHDGVNTNLVAVKTQSIPSANWAPGLGVAAYLYTQTITMPSPYLYASTQIEFRLSTGDIVYPTVTSSSSNTYIVTTTDNTKTYTAIYR